jgi:molybdopterin-guanine dinucleotide biosynthesis protein B
MRRIHIVGRKNHGKTTLIVELVKELARRGIPVGTIKHTHHQHELDVPGKDSYRHRMAGAAAVGVVSPSMSAVFLPTELDRPEVSDRYLNMGPMFARCLLLIVEGDSQAKAPKIEVWRSELGTHPLACHDKSVLAIVTDDALPISGKVLPRSDISGLADWILIQFDKQPIGGASGLVSPPLQ